ncbi:MAG TPA: hypothetical protein VFO31_21320 [Vicinamibacterales bacterium]|nr:hypothetical protein [Vicinamibacterales bacterium]
MPGGVSQTGVNLATGQREWDPLGDVPAPPAAGNPYGVMGNVPLFNRMGAAAGYGPGAPMDAAASGYARLFGTMTPQARVAGGAPPTGPVAGYNWTQTPESQRYANGGGANNAETAPLSTPQEAGERNSVYPGWSGAGHTAVGYPKKELGVSERTATDPLRTALADVPPPGGATIQGGIGGPGYVWNQQTGKFEPPPSGPVDLAATADTTPQGPVEGTTKELQVSGADASAQAAGGGAAPRPPAGEWGFDGKFGGHPPHDFVTVNPGYQLTPSSELTQVSGALAGNRYLTDVAAQLYKLVNGRAGSGPSLASLAAAGGIGSNEWGQLVNQITRMEGYLNAVAPGLNWHPSQTYLAPNNGNGGSGDTGNGGGGNGDNGGGGGGGAGGDIANVGDYLAAAEARVNALMGGGANDPKNAPFRAALVYAMAQDMQRQAMIEQGIGGYQGAIQNFQNDPLRQKQIDMMSGILDKPDNTPWATVQANRASDINKAAEAAAEAASGSAARRLGAGGVAAMPGIAADLKSGAGNAISRMIGDLMVEQAQKERDAQYRALQGASAVRESTTGADADLMSRLAGMYLGSAPGGGNPMAGAAESFVNPYTFYQAQNQASGPSGLEQALAFGAGLLPGMQFSQGGTTAGGGTTGPSGQGLGALIAMLGPTLGI